MDQGAVVSRFVDFTAALQVYNVEILFCGGSMGSLYGFMGVTYYGLVQDFNVKLRYWAEVC